MEKYAAASDSPPPENFYDRRLREANIPAEHVDWSVIDRRLKRNCGLTKSFCWSVVGGALTGSVLFGLNTSALNTSIDHIMSEYNYCDLPADVSCSRARWFKTLLSTSVFMGAALSAMCTSPIVKAYGLRRTTLMTLGVFVMGIFSSICANSFSALFFARFVVGLGVGVVSSTTPNYIAEMVPADKRGLFGCVHQIVLVTSQVLVMAFGLVFWPIPDDETDAAEYNKWTVPILNK